MTLEYKNSYNYRDGNGFTTVFPFGFWSPQESYVKVTRIFADETVVDLGPGDYNVTLSDDGGTVELMLGDGPLPSGQRIYIYRDTPIDQLVTVKNQVSYNPTVVGNVWDKLTAICQELQGKMDLAVLANPGQDVSTIINDLFVAAANAVASAESAAQSAQQALAYGALTFEDAVGFFGSIIPTSGMAGRRAGSQDGSAWDIGAPNSGDYNHPVTGAGVTVVPAANEIKLSAFGNRLSAAILAADLLGAYLVIDRDASFSGMVTVGSLRMRGAGGVLTGYNGTGVLISGSNCVIDIHGPMLIKDFVDGSGDYSQASNYTTAFCRIDSNTTVKSLRVYGISVDKCRSVVRAGLVSDDLGINLTTAIDWYDVSDNMVNLSPLFISLHCEVFGGNFRNNRIYRSVSAGLITNPTGVWMDGQSKADAETYYSRSGRHGFFDNVYHEVVNLNTDGVANAIFASTWAVIAQGNRISEVYTRSGNNGEAIYVKARRTNIQGNVCYNAGVREGAIANKGRSEAEYAATSSNVSPLAGDNVIADNIICFDKYSYDLTTLWGIGGIVNVQRPGMLVLSQEGVIIRNNLFDGCTSQGVEIRGSTSGSGSPLQAGGNVMRNHRAPTGIAIVGSYENIELDGVLVEWADNYAGVSVAVVTVAESVAVDGPRKKLRARKLSGHHKNAAFSNSLRGVTLTVDNCATGVVDIDGVKLSRAGTSGSVSGVLIFRASNISTEVIEKLKVRDVDLGTPWVGNGTQYVNFDTSNGGAAAKVKAFEADVRIHAKRTNGAIASVFSIPVAEGYVGHVRARASGVQNNRAAGLLTSLDAVYEKTTGTVTAVLTADAIKKTFGTITNANTALSISAGVGASIGIASNDGANEWQFDIDVAVAVYAG